jgi:hypothetical protein
VISLQTARAAWLAEFRRAKAQIDTALLQLNDEQFRARLTPQTNSCAIIVKHLAGNMRSRWTDWLTTDGEKPDRNRDEEFIDAAESRADLMRRYEQGWALVFAAIERLSEADLARTILIRSHAHTVPEAIERQIAHYAYHAGQIQLISRGVHGNEGWKWASIPPGGSDAFNRSMRS